MIFNCSVSAFNINLLLKNLKYIHHLLFRLPVVCKIPFIVKWIVDNFNVSDALESES